MKKFIIIIAAFFLTVSLKAQTRTGGGSGGGSAGVKVVTSNGYTIISSDREKRMSLQNLSAQTITFPAAGGSFPNQWCTNIGVDGAGNANWTIAATPTTVLGLATSTLSLNQSARICSSGSNWYADTGVGGGGGAPPGGANVVPMNGGAGSYAASSLVDSGVVNSTENAAFGGTISSGSNVPLNYGNGASQSVIGGVEGTCGTTDTTAGSFKFCMASVDHEMGLSTNGTNNYGKLVRSQPSPVSLTGQTAPIANGTTLCDAVAGSCNVAGLYRVSAYFTASVAGTGNIGFNLTYTDETGTKTGQTVPLDVAGATSLTGTMLLTSGNNATARSALWSTGVSAIQYGITYTSTGTYTARIVVERLF